MAKTITNIFGKTNKKLKPVELEPKDLKFLDEMGFYFIDGRYYHNELNHFGVFLRLEIDLRALMFVGSFEWLNKIPITDKEHLINFVKYCFGVELK